MKKRLSKTAALLHQPDVLLLDEPTVGIDSVLRRSVWNQFKEMNKAALIYNGKLIHYDSVQNLLAKTIDGTGADAFCNWRP